MRVKTESARIRIAARHSDLARLQAYRVGEALQAARPGLEIEYAFRASLGDQNQSDPLWKMPEKGVFTEDFLADLKEGAADLVVHSWKDLPTEPRPDTEIVATLPRADGRDLMLFRRDRLAGARASGKVRVLTSSPRRAYNLEKFLCAHLPFEVRDLAFESVRGNIPTRLKKLLAQDVDALIVAKAALDRLLAAPEPEFDEVKAVIRETLAKTHFMVLPLSANPTAAAQGALAVEIRRDRADLRTLLGKIHCRETFEAVERERALLAGYGGGCHQKIGVSVVRRPFGEITFLKGLTDAGEVLDRAELVTGERAQPQAEAPDRLFPRQGEETSFFARESLAREAWAWAERERFLWVARETAWPRDFRAREDAIVWTAGLRTWAKLAARGIWISGSVESLGEDEVAAVEWLAGEARPSWVKLTHESAGEFHRPPSAKACATYRLKTKTEGMPDLSSRTHFFWSSASAFARALELEPRIRSAHHASGPGATARYLRESLGPDVAIGVHLDIDAWRKSILSSAKFAGASGRSNGRD